MYGLQGISEEPHLECGLRVLLWDRATPDTQRRSVSELEAETMSTYVKVNNYLVGGLTSIPVKWDSIRSAKQVRCQNCQMRPFYSAPLDDRPFTDECEVCQGTNRQAVPWTELFITSPHRRRD